jgi:DNA-binding GntR family transcriptional regulator
MDSVRNTQKPKKKRKADASISGLVDALREAIIFGRYRPRERLVEEELTEKFGATRHNLRNAFTELSHAGLVERRPNKGVIVRDFSVDELEELYEMRIILQSEAARRIPLPADSTLITELRSINAAYLKALDDGDKEESSRINTNFHERLFGACGNRFLSDAINLFWLRTTPIHWYVLGDSNHLRNSYRSHEAMIDALENGDQQKLVDVCREHILPALKAYRRVHGDDRTTEG